MAGESTVGPFQRKLPDEQAHHAFFALGLPTGQKKSRSSEIDYYIQSLTDRLKQSLGTKVEIKKRGRQGCVVIHFYSDDELDRLLDLLA